MSGIKDRKSARSRAHRETEARRQAHDARRRVSSSSAASAQRRQASSARRANSAPQRRRTSSRRRVQRNIRPSFWYRFKRKLPYIAAVIGIVLLVWGGLTAFHWLSLRGYDKTKIATTVKIGPVDVSGMTQKEAAKTVDHYVKIHGAKLVTMIMDDENIDVSLKELGLKAKGSKKQAAEALAYGSAGSVNQRYKKIHALKKKAYVMPLKVELDHDITKQFIESECAPGLEGPQNATFEIEGDDIEIIDGKSGMLVDSEEAIDLIENKLSKDWDGGDISVKVNIRKTEPEVTKADLKKMKDELGSYSTSFPGSDAGRVSNIKNGVSMINGTLLEPGETFSADAAMRPYTEERGWMAAGSYENGDIVDTLGGGVCQISSTLYNAVLYAELEVVERKPHSRRVQYVDPGRDAAIAGDYKDLKFKNNLDKPIYIYGNVTSETVTFIIFGTETRPKDRSIEFESEILSTEDFEITYKASPEDKVGAMYKAVNGHEGMEAKLWKIVTEGGKEGKKEKVNDSIYVPQDTIIKVGTNGSGAGIINSAIRTQDKDKIRAAIAKAKKAGKE